MAVAIFLWAVKSEQFEDLERQGHNILFDEDTEATHQQRKKEKSKEGNDSES
ncbi:type cbb3 cytochrome oxidase biogenesis protein CcoS [Vibrio maritimus]|uniref:Type cbb3 cytochrome oxidase biogenesis protein CcoS n=1 Tax=Vibrio maritimus TaxID=990268 RepID=A0A090RXG6_9VIBR|nr:type cbb3 cytochrome oxidase biogenesis protein CcoS [Vibrio maritimus]